MSDQKPVSFLSREERKLPREGGVLLVQFLSPDNRQMEAVITDVSRSGFQCLIGSGGNDLAPGASLRHMNMFAERHLLGPLIGVIRHQQVNSKSPHPDPAVRVGVELSDPDTNLKEVLAGYLKEQPYITAELKEGATEQLHSEISAEDYSAKDFLDSDSPNLFDKCNRFYEFYKDILKKQFFQCQYRVTLTSGLDHRICVFNPLKRIEQEMVCFDSNSYLGLHQHPRVLKVVREVLDRFGYGTPSAQVLCGTSRYLRELEQLLSDFFGREDAIVFSTGYGTNIGVVTALVREKDLVVRDRFAHASLHDGALYSRTPHARIYRHNDMADLDRILTEEGPKVSGKLILTDGVFSMHGRLAPLPELVRVAKKHQAYLLVDEAHTTGVLGKTGRGMEEHFGMPGSVDILMGTFSKAPGALGGYVVGSKELIAYLRFYARSGVFTAALPAHICAGISEAFRIMMEEPEHREALWKNLDYFVPKVQEMGYSCPKAESGIVPIFVGSQVLLWLFSMDLFSQGIKCGNVSYPAVPRGDAILRFTINARHNRDDLDRALEVLYQLGHKYRVLGHTQEELKTWERWFAAP